MSTVKRTLVNVSFYDSEAIQQKLEQMAARGWMIQKAGNLFWTYTKIPPQKLRFAVTYFPGASEFDPRPSEKQLEREELCAQDGWRLVLRWDAMQIFCTDREDAVPIETDFGDADVLRITQIWKKVRDEREKTLQFLRFQKAADGTYFAATAPRYDTLPLVVPYALDRFADQRWLIYDARRDYGYYYDLREATEVRFEKEDIHLRAGLLGEDIMDKDERLFQAMWRAYFQSTAIRERLNPRLQRQHMPARFWRFLPEKR